MYPKINEIFIYFPTVHLKLKMTYLVVKYIDSHEIVVIPSGWLNGNNCALWPPYKTSARINQAVQQNEVPGENWVAYPVKLLYMSGKFILC